LAFLPSDAGDILKELPAPEGVVAIEVTIEFDRQGHSDEKLVAAKDRQTEQEKRLGCLQNRGIQEKRLELVI
jgi:hypothetical protein